VNAYLPLITVFVSGAFGLLVAIVTIWMTTQRESRNYTRDRARQRFEDSKSLYANYFAQLEKCIRCTEQRGDVSSLTDALPLLNAQLNLTASKEVVSQTHICSELLYEWSTEYRRGSPKQVGDTNVAIFSSGDSEHCAKAKELRPRLMNELTKLIDLMKSHLESIEPWDSPDIPNHEDVAAEVTHEPDPKNPPWRCFEEEVATHIERELHYCRLGFTSAAARVVRKPSYYSKLRNASIIFDVTLEVFAPAAPEAPFFIWIWECKDYPSTTVRVDELEEFHHKLTQVAAHKGTVVTRCGFQKAAVELAKSLHIGLITLVKEVHTIVQMSQDGGIFRKEVLSGFYSLDTLGKERFAQGETSGPNIGSLIQVELDYSAPSHWRTFAARFALMLL
jgi:hypothetical protein